MGLRQLEENETADRLQKHQIKRLYRYIWDRYWVDNNNAPSGTGTGFLTFIKEAALNEASMNARVSTFYELKQVILSHLEADGPREIRRLAYQFQTVTPDDRLEYRPSQVHRRIMQDRFMEFLAEVCHVGESSGFRLYQLPADPAPINIVPPDYNSDEDSDYDDKSSGDSTDEDELVQNTPAAGGPRLVLPAPKPIPTLTDVPSFFRVHGQRLVLLHLRPYQYCSECKIY
ncbi:hypothetical protein PIB30_050385 [Stylosanthes scabra]|uniref:Uncharacterized protein n=1 Tax=Stylosanthes scabra TaxID=79078 RepID=A0ABU6SIR4_9FABA|nr:hypothetical protein [Stylosanthes scabra]